MFNKIIRQWLYIHIKNKQKIILKKTVKKHETLLANNYLCTSTCDSGCSLTLVLGGLSNYPYTDGSSASIRKNHIHIYKYTPDIKKCAELYMQKKRKERKKTNNFFFVL